MKKGNIKIDKTDKSTINEAKRTANGVQSHVDMAIGTQLYRESFQRERALFAIKIIYPLILFCILSLLFNIYLATRPTKTAYFATSPNGRMMEFSLLDSPLRSEEFVLRWASEAVFSAYSMSFADYQRTLNEIRPYFTEAGWKGYQKAMDDTGFLTNLLNNRYITKAGQNEAPIVRNAGIIKSSGTYAWRIQIPMKITFKSTSQTTTSDHIIEVVVIRVPPEQNPSGLAITQIVIPN